MSSYIFETISIQNVPSPIVLLNIINPVFIKKCYLQNCGSIEDDFGALSIKLNESFALIKDLGGERCSSMNDIQFMNIVTNESSLPVNISRMSICKCAETDRTNESHSFILKGKISMNELNITENKSMYDSAISLFPSPEGSMIKNILVHNCRSKKWIVLYFYMNNLSIHFLDFVNNSAESNEYGLLLTRGANVTVIKSNFIGASTITLLGVHDVGPLTINDCFINYSGQTKTTEACVIINPKSIPNEIKIKPVSKNECRARTLKWQRNFNFLNSLFINFHCYYSIKAYVFIM